MTCLDDKPVRLLASGAVLVTRVSDTRVDATVAGDHGRYRVVRTPGGWECDCPGWRYRHTCSHVRAVATVTTARPRRRQAAP